MERARGVSTCGPSARADLREDRPAVAISPRTARDAIDIGDFPDSRRYRLMVRGG